MARGLVVMEEVVKMVVVVMMVMAVVAGNRGKGDGGLWRRRVVLRAVVVEAVWDGVNSGKWCCRW